MFGNSNGLHVLNKLRHGDLDGLSIVLLTPLSTTKSKSTLIQGSKLKLSPKPLHSFLKSEIPTTNKIINTYSKHSLNMSLSFSTIQQRFSTGLARQQRNTFHRTGRRENPNRRVHVQRNKTSLSKCSAEPLVPVKWCIYEAIDCLSQSQHVFRSKIQPTLRSDDGLMYNASLPVCAGSTFHFPTNVSPPSDVLLVPHSRQASCHRAYFDIGK